MNNQKLNEIFSSVTLIKPAPNSSALFGKREVSDKIGISTEAVEEQWGVDENGKDKLITSNVYNKQRFPGTNQIIRGSMWDDNNNRWMIIDPEDMLKKRNLEQNSEVLNILVANCRLVNKRSGDPKYGQYITEADIFNRFDPFFSHPEYEFPLNAGEAYIKSTLKDPLNVLILLGYIARRMLFEVGSTGKYIPRGRNIKYIIVDKNIERQEKTQKREKEARAFDTYNQLRKDTKRLIMLSCALGHDIRDPEVADDIIHSYATDDITRDTVNKTKTKMDVFLTMVDSPVSTIKAYYVFTIGVSTGTIRIQNKSYTAFGQSLGATKLDVISYFLNENNDSMSRVEAAALELRTTLKVAPKPEDNTSFISQSIDTQINSPITDSILNSLEVLDDVLDKDKVKNQSNNQNKDFDGGKVSKSTDKE